MFKRLMLTVGLLFIGGCLSETTALSDALKIVAKLAGDGIGIDPAWPEVLER